MDNQNLQADENPVFMSQNKKVLQANESCASKPQNKKNLQADEDIISNPQNKKKLYESMENSDTNLSKVFTCHRLPERTFKVGDQHFPVCSRPTLIYIGTFYYILVYFVCIQHKFTLILIGALMILPLFSVVLTQFFGFKESNNALRFSWINCRNWNFKSVKYGSLY